MFKTYTNNSLGLWLLALVMTYRPILHYVML